MVVVMSVILCSAVVVVMSVILCSAIVFSDRQENCEGGALSERAGHADLATMLLDDAIADRETQAGAGADAFCGEKRIEDPLANMFRNAGPRILHAEQHLLPL